MKKFNKLTEKQMSKKNGGFIVETILIVGTVAGLGGLGVAAGQGKIEI